MGDVEVEKISNHQAEVGHFGVEADEEAIGKIIDKIETDDRLIEKILSDDETLRKIIVKLQSGYYQPELAEPASGTNDLDSLIGGYDLLAQVENIGILFHNVVRHFRDTQRHESVFMQHKIVETQNASAGKKDEASDKLGDAALTGLILTCVGFAVGVAFAGLGPLMMGGRGAQAATKATQETAESAERLAQESAELVTRSAPPPPAGPHAPPIPPVQTHQDAVQINNKTTALSNNLNNTSRKAQMAEKQIYSYDRTGANKTYKECKNELDIQKWRAQNAAVDARSLAQAETTGLNRPGVVQQARTVEQQADTTFNKANQAINRIDKVTRRVALKGLGDGAVKTLMTPMASAMYFTGAQQYATTKGQADSQKSQADGDRLSALAEGEKSQKQRTDDYTSTFTDSMKTVRQKLSEMIESVQRGMEAAAKI